MPVLREAATNNPWQILPIELNLQKKTLAAVIFSVNGGDRYENFGRV